MDSQPAASLLARPHSAAPAAKTQQAMADDASQSQAFSPQYVLEGQARPASATTAANRPLSAAGAGADAASRLRSRPSPDFLADRHQPPPGCFGAQAAHPSAARAHPHALFCAHSLRARALRYRSARVGICRVLEYLHAAALVSVFAGVDPKEMYAAMLVRERLRIPIDQTNSYLQYRTIIVDWMCEVAEEFKLNPYAVQLSVHYFDLALQRVKVKKSQLQLVAMCCTLLAGASLQAHRLFCASNLCARVRRANASSAAARADSSLSLSRAQPNSTARRSACRRSTSLTRVLKTPTIGRRLYGWRLSSSVL